MPIVRPSKRIQEISAEGEEPPPEFFVKDTVLAGNLGSIPIEIPIIDLNLLSLDPNSEVYKGEMNKLLFALSSWGVFQVLFNFLCYMFNFVFSVSLIFIYRRSKTELLTLVIEKSNFFTHTLLSCFNHHRNSVYFVALTELYSLGYAVIFPSNFRTSLFQYVYTTFLKSQTCSCLQVCDPPFAKGLFLIVVL